MQTLGEYSIIISNSRDRSDNVYGIATLSSCVHILILCVFNPLVYVFAKPNRLKMVSFSWVDVVQVWPKTPNTTGRFHGYGPKNEMFSYIIFSERTSL